MSLVRRVLVARVGVLGALSCAALAFSTSLAADPWADRVVSFSAGTGGSDGYDLASSALGSPTRFTGVSFGFPSAVTPFSPAFERTDIVSLGLGGHITVAFDEPVTNDAANPFGLDLLIFGNSFFYDADWPSGRVGGFAGEGGLIEISADGLAWHAVPFLAADAGYPTLGYLDLATPYSDTPGAIDSDFTRPVDPSFDASDKTYAEIVAAYRGSGGGLGVDLSLVGLDAISFVRVTNPDSMGGTPEIDAFADVSPIPAPGVVSFGAMGVLAASRWPATPRRARATKPRAGSAGALA
ncbi:MAG: hypothetical protein JNL50_10480 [Phycisphaerae bacterium]|nr:hypothetical protein [Phycisphaerae bacterium]